MNDKGMIDPFLAFSSVSPFKLQNKSQFNKQKTLLHLEWMIFWQIAELQSLFKPIC